MSHKGLPKGPYRRVPKDSAYAGSVTCLRCDEAFWSWDRRQNRLCPPCRQTIDQEPSAEEPHRLFQPPTPRPRNREDG
jgi:hypothetical protein